MSLKALVIVATAVGAHGTSFGNRNAPEQRTSNMKHTQPGM